MDVCCCVYHFTWPPLPPAFPSLQTGIILCPQPGFILLASFPPDAAADGGDPHPRGEADGAAQAPARPLVFLLPGTQGESREALWGYNPGKAFV